MNPEIPYGYKRVQGQLQKGDGVWDAESGKFRKVRKEYPDADGSQPVFAIRKCEVEQTELPGVADAL